MSTNQFDGQTVFQGRDGNAVLFGAPSSFDIKEELAHAESIQLATAFARMSGWNLLKDAILKSEGMVYLLAGLDYNLTEPKLLAQWMDASEKPSINARVFDRHDAFFHPKVLIVNGESRNPQRRFAVIGSGNLSEAGLLDNVECSIYTDEDKLVAGLSAWFARLFARAIPVTLELITKYEAGYHATAHIRETQRRANRQRRKRIDDVRKAIVAHKLEKTLGKNPTFHVVNTNMKHDKDAQTYMLESHKACAYESGWMEKVENIQKGDVVFLYRSSKWHTEVPGGPGIVAFGLATGKLDNRPSENTCCAVLEDFRRIHPPISAPEISSIHGSRVTFGQVWHRPNQDLAKKLYREALRRCF